MKISTKGRYALSFITELALDGGDKCIPLKNIAQRHHISEKYLEQIAASLNKAKLIKSVRGSQGGYKLVKSPCEYTVGEILRSTEKTLAPVSCLEYEKNDCPYSNDCISLFVWEEIYKAVNDVVNAITVQDIIDRGKHQNKQQDV